MSLEKIEYMRGIAEYCYKKENVRAAIIQFRRILRKHVKDEELKTILFDDFCRSLTTKDHTSLWMTRLQKVPQLEDNTSSHNIRLLVEHYLRFHSFLEDQHDRWLSLMQTKDLEPINDPLALYFQMKAGNGYILDGFEMTVNHAMISEHKAPGLSYCAGILHYASKRQDPQLSRILTEIPAITMLRRTRPAWLACVYPALIAKGDIQTVASLEYYMNTLLSDPFSSYVGYTDRIDELNPVNIYHLSWKSIMDEGCTQIQKEQAWVMQILMHLPYFQEHKVSMEWGPKYVYKDNRIVLPEEMKSAWVTHVFPMWHRCMGFYKKLTTPHENNFGKDMCDARNAYIRQQLHQLTLGAPNIDELTGSLTSDQYIHYLKEHMRTPVALELDQTDLQFAV